MEHKNDKTKETTPSSTESKGVLGTVWSAAGALAETVQHAVQGTIDAAYHTADRIQHEVEPVTNMVTESITDIKDKTADMLGLEKQKQVDATDAFFSSPTNDMMEATKSEPSESASAEIDTPPAPSLFLATSELIDNAKKQVTDIVHKAIDSSKDLVDDVSKALQETTLNEQPKLELTMDIVAHLQRIADRTGDAILHDTARKAHSACAKGLSEAPGVNLVRVTPEQATELVNLAILTQDHELADFARYCQSVAATTQIGIEPSPGKIQEELAKGRMELSTQGRMHTGPGYGAAFASVSRSTSSSNLLSSAPVSRSTSSTNLLASASGSGSGSTSGSAPASRTTSSSNLFQSIQSELQQLQKQEGDLQLTMDMVAHLQRIADRTGDLVLHDTARKAHSACAKNLSDAPGVHLVSITPDQASELVNLAIRTQDHELANFARYCQSVAATTQVGIEPSPGKIMQEIEKGRQELLQQGRTHNGPGYGAAFASISRSNSSTNLSLSRSNSSSSLSLSAKNSRSSSPTNVPIAPSSEAVAAQSMQLTMEVVAHLQRIADRTGDSLLHDTARKAHSACAKNLSDAPGVHLTVITPDQATELVNLAIRTQDTELADFARYCQSVAATTQVGIEPSPGKIMQEIEKGRQELLQQGRTHTGPGYGAAFASKPLQQVKVEKIDKLETKASQDEIISATPSTMVGLPSQ